MNDLIEFLKENNVHYDVGIINNNTFVKLPKPFENEQAIRFKWKKSSTDNLQKN